MLAKKNGSSRTKEGVVTSYGYDLLERTISLSKPGAALTFGYDPLGRIIREAVRYEA